MKNEREFDFTDHHFHQVKAFIASHAGIALSDAKRDMVYGRLVRRLRVHRLDNFDDYLALVQREGSSEVVNFINALTTNLTSFFREKHHFEFLRTTALPYLEQARSHSRQIRIWSAGCSTGEEPYSIAMTLLDYFGSQSGSWDLSITASDLDTNVVQTAQQGVYALERVKDLPTERLRRWFLKGKGDNQNRVRVKPELQQLIHFRQLNLLHSWPFHEPFDIIFCRNVVIYFNKETQRSLFDRFADNLANDGNLLIGHSESLHRICDRFNLIGQTIHSKIS